ncbi:MFS transporter [Levilactobacillus spicheri]|uniref:MFS transporter n=2 Tax=Levilactobacillus spicheri TaxID=216463 RepID=A0ABQ0WQ23_9LACO|nr:MFS transporter [Levilactobacillus spicheri]KRL48612.1 transporter, major facilitator family protein [Levilactobacillus spicheri DSM 15429]GEO66964.1 MFS transporter [Levilactobacillus spicheri]
MSAQSRQRVVLIIAMLSYFLTALSNSLVLTSLAKLTADLNLTAVSLPWVQNAYGLAFGSFLLIGGRLSDAFSRRRVLDIALVIFMLGSLLSGLAPNGFIMIAARFLQGIGSALLAPTSMALLIDYFTGPSLVKAIAWYSSVAGLGSSVGLVVGGVLASYLSWRIGFYLNVPLCLLMLGLAWWALHENPATTHEPLDVWGTLTSVLGCGLLVYALNGAAQPVVTLLAALVILAGFVVIEKRSPHPTLPLIIFHSWTRTNGYLSRALLNGAVMGYWFFIAEYLQQVRHYSPFKVGLAYLPLSLTMFLGAMIVPRLIDRWLNKRVLVVAVAIEFVGFALSLLAFGQTYWPSVGIPMMIIGIGQGLALAPLTNMGIYQVAADQSGVASGLVNAGHQLGGVLGLALMVNVSALLVPTQAIASEFRIALIIALVMVAVVTGLALTGKRDV